MSIEELQNDANTTGRSLVDQADGIAKSGAGVNDNITQQHAEKRVEQMHARHGDIVGKLGKVTAPMPL